MHVDVLFNNNTTVVGIVSCNITTTTNTMCGFNHWLDKLAHDIVGTNQGTKLIHIKIIYYVSYYRASERTGPDRTGPNQQNPEVPTRNNKPIDYLRTFRAADLLRASVIV